MKEVQWVVQGNLTEDSTLETLRDACAAVGVDCVEVDIVPFTREIPLFPERTASIFYGSTRFIERICETESSLPGLFFNAETFLMEVYLPKWKDHMLNFGARITTFGELLKEDLDKEKRLFLRPNDDAKSFAGETKLFGEIGTWYEGLRSGNHLPFGPETKVVVAEPWSIEKEWRLWIVNRKVVASTGYRERFRLKPESGSPPEVIAFAEMRCREFTPHDVFVMDVGLCGDRYYIIECGCMNAAGFYAANVRAIVDAVSSYVAALTERA